MAAPDLEKEQEFIITSPDSSKEGEERGHTKSTKKLENMESDRTSPVETSVEVDDFDLSDISHLKPDFSREEIIAAAEAAAFADE